MNRYYTRVIEVNLEGKITSEFIGELFYGNFPAIQPCSYGGRTRIYGSTKKELIANLNLANLFTSATIFQDEIET